MDSDRQTDRQTDVVCFIADSCNKIEPRYIAHCWWADARQSGVGILMHIMHHGGVKTDANGINQAKGKEIYCG